jgi:3-hydroxyisobutyrate dehydrogenase
MNIGLIGAGLMGTPMGEKILAAKHSLIVYNRTAEKTKPLVDKGAVQASSPVEVIEKSDIIITMLANGDAVREMLFGARTSFKNKTVLQMSTISAAESKEFDKKTRALDGQYLEAPVLGSGPQIREGKLIVMVGGPYKLYEKYSPALKVFTKRPLYIGEVGKAAALKLAFNQLIASLTAAFSLSFGIVQREGINTEIFMNILRQSALYAPTFDKKLDKMISKDYSDVNFPVKHLLKDVNLVIDEAKSLGIDVTAVEGVKGLLQSAIDKGLQNEDYSAMFLAVNP